MQLTRKQLRDIINEEVERFSSEESELENLLENFSASYEVDQDNISKEAFVNFLELMNEEKIPKMAFDAFIKNLSQVTAASVLNEAIED